MSDLTKFRDHAAVMAAGGHTPACEAAEAEAARRWGYFRMFREWLDDWGPKPSGPPEPCEGACSSAADRALWALLAAEVNEYLDQPSAVDPFGEMTAEPTVDTDRAGVVDGGGEVSS